LYNPIIAAFLSLDDRASPLKELQLAEKQDQLVAWPTNISLRQAVRLTFKTDAADTVVGRPANTSDNLAHPTKLNPSHHSS
jgi:hypothetical protein